MTISKAEETRRRVQKNALQDKLKLMLAGLEDRFLGAYKDYNVNQMIRQGEPHNYPTWKDAVTAYEGKRYSEIGILPPMTGNYERVDTVLTQNQIIRLWSKANYARKQLQRINSLTHSLYNEAHKGWIQRFDKLVLRVLSEAKSTERMTLTHGEAQGDELEILITQETQVFHCRFIWVNCTEKASHHRFIVTTRKIK
jgi:hypothetical protein